MRIASSGSVKPNWTSGNESRDAGSVNKRLSDKNRTIQQWKCKAKIIAYGLGIMLTWYLTPVSDCIADLWLMWIPISADIKLGREISYTTPFHDTYSKEWSPLITKIGNDLVTSDPHMAEYKWDFGVNRANVVNAFALPGGKIRITDALLREVNPSEGEVAALLAHEIGHVVNRHTQRRVQKARMASMFLDVASFLLEVMFDLSNDVKARQNMQKSLTSVAFYGEQGFSRRDEYQADSTGWDLLACDTNAYTPLSLHSILEKLDRIEKIYLEKNKKQGYNTVVGGWSSTHPPTSGRVRALKSKWRRLSPFEKAKLSQNAI